ncbi:MAG: hypothetical protein CL678_07245 [Bdellovibrionaceae bacterium]|nr:hypothetical protein [Pseudobdellovibrionaceae bacterium]|tara:strand:+ start:3013 stop:4425 length:1413 start_codon:yes stop_codon:yes gene_type:complete
MKLKLHYHWVLGPFLSILTWILPLPLKHNAHLIASLMIGVITYWILTPIPLAVTGLLATALLPLLGICSAQSAFSGYGHPLVFLFMGGFLIAKAMEVQKADQRIALNLLTAPGISGHPLRSIIALIFLSAVLSMFLSNTATTAMLLPIASGVLTHIFKKEKTSQGLVLLFIAYASSIGGMGTPVGSTPNMIALGLIEKFGGPQIDFFSWMVQVAPLSILMIFILVFVLKWKLPSLPSWIPTENLKKQKQNLGSLSSHEKITFFSGIVAISLWILPSLFQVFFPESPLSPLLKNHLPESAVALIAASFLFLLKVDEKPALSWKQATSIDWNSLLLFGAGMSLGTQVFETGLASQIGQGLISITSHPSQILFLFIIVTLFFTETTSNTATANLVIPLVYATSSDLGIDPWLPIQSVALACSLAFMMPVSTPPNAIVFGSGKISPKLMIRVGFFLNIGASILIYFWGKIVSSI